MARNARGAVKGLAALTLAIGVLGGAARPLPLIETHPAATSATTPAGTSPADTASSRTASSGASATARHPTGTLSVVVLGDSVPAGTACDCSGFGTLVADQLGSTQGRTVSVDNEAVPGSTSDDVVDQLQDDSIRSAVASADLVIVETGANDFDTDAITDSDCTSAADCYGDQLTRTQAHIASISGALAQLQTKPTAQTVLLGYWNVFLDGDGAQSLGSRYVALSDALTQDLNSAIASAAAANKQLSPDVYTAFKETGAGNDTALLAADGEHPNARGHELIAYSIMHTLGSRAAEL